LSQGNAVLHKHLGHVEVHAVLEGDCERVGAVVGALRSHVHHVFDAVDLLLDGSCHGVGHDLGVGAGINGRDFHCGRRDLRILGDRQAKHGDQPGQCHEDRQHGCENRPVNKEAIKHVEPNNNKE
jgi:hypothetical protein